jgi:Cu+-exporting ATPase
VNADSRFVKRTGEFVDPVCGMTVRPDGHRVEHAGHEYRFCGARCKEKFANDPDAFLVRSTPSSHLHATGDRAAHDHASHVGHSAPHSSAPKPTSHERASHAQASTQRKHPTARYYCSMDEDVESDVPGDCPKCGMALEPNPAVVDERANSEVADMTRRLVWATALTLPVLVLAMGDMVAGHPFSQLLGGAKPWLEAALATPVCVWAAWPFHVRAVRSVVNRSPNMFTLIGLGVAVAYGYSVIATLIPDAFPPAFRDHAGHVGVYLKRRP